MKKTTALLTTVILLLFTPSVGCERAKELPPIRMTAVIGGKATRNHIAEIDTSNTKDGYLLVRYLEKPDQAAKVMVTKHGGTPYIYTLRLDREYETLPLSEGNGNYRITVYKNMIDNKYSPVLETTLSVRLTDEFAPFIRPNQYVDYSRDSKVPEKAFALTQNTTKTTDKISSIYRYIIENIAYDRQLAANVQGGYIPDAEQVLKNGKGICFDYASLMAAMLRSQGIPTKLIVGYKGEAYHAWISAYSDETGWRLMDPTSASVGDEAQYSAKYIY